MGNRVFRRRCKVLIGVPLRSDGSRARRLASYNVGGVRQARQIELLKYHMNIRLRPLPPAGARSADKAEAPSSRLDTFSELRRRKRYR